MNQFYSSMLIGALFAIVGAIYKDNYPLNIIWHVLAGTWFVNGLFLLIVKAL